jgi:hypothetical protein
MYEAYRRMYEAIGVRDIDTILNTQQVDKPKDPASENAQALDGSPLKAFAGQQHDAHIMTHIMFGLNPMMQGMPNVAVTIQKHIFDHIRLKAEEEVEADLFRQYGTDPDSMISALQREAMVAIKVAQGYQEVKGLQTQMMGPQDDPLIKLKEQELAQSAQRDQAKLQMDQQRLGLDQQKEQADVQFDSARLALQQQAAAQRNSQDAIRNAQQGAKNANQSSKKD